MFVKKEDTPSDETVEVYHKQFIKSMTDLYERHKVENGYGERKLIIA